MMRVIDEQNKWLMDREKEKAQLDSLSKNEKAYLSRRECALCNQKLNLRFCGDFYGQCSALIRIEKRIKCLKEYKPRRSQQQKFVEKLFGVINER